MPTTADLLAFTRDLLSEHGAGDFFDDAVEVLPLLNDGKNKMFAVLEVLPVVLTPITATSGVSTYNVTQKIGRFENLLHSGVSLTPLDFWAYAKKTARAGTPTHYVPQVTDLATGADQIILYPTPAATAPSGITGFGWGVPSDLVTAPSGSVVNPTWHAHEHFLPCYWAAAQLMRKNVKPADAMELEGLFWAGVRRYQDWYNEKFPPRAVETEDVGLASTYKDPNAYVVTKP